MSAIVKMVTALLSETSRQNGSVCCRVTSKGTASLTLSRQGMGLNWKCRLDGLAKRQNEEMKSTPVQFSVATLKSKSAAIVSILVCMLVCFIPCANATTTSFNGLLFGCLQLTSSIRYAISSTTAIAVNASPTNMNLSFSTASITYQVSSLTGLSFAVNSEKQNNKTTETSIKAVLPVIYFGVFAMIIGTLLLVIMNYGLNKQRKGFYDVQGRYRKADVATKSQIVTLVVLCLINGVSADNCPQPNMIPIYAAFTFVGMAIGFFLCGCVNLCKSTEEPVETIVINTPRTSRETPPPYPGTGPGTRAAPSIWAIAILGLLFVYTTEALETPKIILNNPICNAYPVPTRTYCSISVYSKVTPGMLNYTNRKHEPVTDQVYGVIAVPFNSTFSCYNATTAYEYKVKDVCDPGKNYVIPVFLGLVLGFITSIVMLLTGDAEKNAQLMDIEANRHPDGLIPNNVFLFLAVIALVQPAYGTETFREVKSISLFDGDTAFLRVPYVVNPYHVEWTNINFLLYLKIYNDTLVSLKNTTKYTLEKDSLYIKDVSLTENNDMYIFHRQRQNGTIEEFFTFILNVTFKPVMPITGVFFIKNTTNILNLPFFSNEYTWKKSTTQLLNFQNKVRYPHSASLPHTTKMFTFLQNGSLQFNNVNDNHSGFYSLEITIQIKKQSYIKIFPYFVTILEPTFYTAGTIFKETYSNWYIWVSVCFVLTFVLTIIYFAYDYYLKKSSPSEFVASSYKIFPKQQLLLLAILYIIQPTVALPDWFTDKNTTLVITLSVVLALLIMANIIVILLLIHLFKNCQYSYRKLHNEDLEAQTASKMSSGRGKSFIPYFILVCCMVSTTHAFTLGHSINHNTAKNNLIRKPRSFIGTLLEPLIESESAVFWTKQTINALIGDTIYLTVKNSQSPVFSWWQNDFKVENTSLYTVFPNHSLQIFVNSTKQAGIYKYYETDFSTIPIPIKTFEIIVATDISVTFFLGCSGILQIPEEKILKTYWFKNGIKLTKYEEHVDFIEFPNVTSDYAGIYEVLVDSIKPYRSRFFFNVNVQPVQSFFVNYYEPFRFNINIQQGFKYKWLFGTIEHKVPTYQADFDIFKNGTVSFPMCKFFQTNAYELVIEYNGLIFIVAAFELQVQFSVTAFLNKNVVLRTPLTIPDPNWWDFENTNLTSSEKYYMFNNSLVIRHVNFTDDGLYTAHFNGHENENLLFNLTVLKCNNTDRKESFVGTEGHSICFPGCVEATATYFWYKENHLLTIEGYSSSPRLYTIDGSLCIKNLLLNDSGNYIFVKELNNQKHVISYSLSIIPITSRTYVNCVLGNECSITFNPSLTGATFAELWHLSHNSTEYDNLIALYDANIGIYENFTASGYYFNLTQLYIYQLNTTTTFDLILFSGFEDDYNEGNAEKASIYRYIVANQSTTIMPLTTPAPSNSIFNRLSRLNLVNAFLHF